MHTNYHFEMYKRILCWKWYGYPLETDLSCSCEFKNLKATFFPKIELGSQWGRQGYSKPRAIRVLGAVFIEVAHAKTAYEKHQQHSMAAIVNIVTVFR